MPNTDPNAGTTPEGGEAQSETTGTPTAPDEVTTLRSRNAGLDAKVTSLTQQAAAEKARADAAEARALALAEAKENGDAEIRAQLEAERVASAQARAEARKARLETRYPETIAVLGDAALSLTDDQLAANEARLVGSGIGESPTPVGNNPARGQAASPKSIEDMSVAELRAHMLSFDPGVMTSTRVE